MKLYVVREIGLDEMIGIYTTQGLEKLKASLWERYIRSDSLKLWYSDFKSYFAENYSVRKYQVNQEYIFE